MNRRTFTKSVVAAFASSALGAGLPSNHRPAIDLKPFCEPEICRYDLASPFYQSSHIVASDGRVLVRMPKVLDLGNGSKRVPDLSHLDMSLLDRSGWKPWPKGGYVDTSSMDRFLGSLCDRCEDGLLNRQACCDELLCHKCIENDGFVGERCSNCNGQGWLPIAKQMAGALLATNYEKKLLTLPGLQWHPEFSEQIANFGAVPLWRNPPPQPIPFRFDGGHGLVMPLQGMIS